MKKYYILLIAVFLPLMAFNQMISLTPSDAGADDAASITFNAAEGNGDLVGAAKVYIHHGVVLDEPTGTTWSNVIGNWGQDDGVGEMTNVGTDLWEIELTPSIREYFGVDEGTDIFRISAVFRSADGSAKGTLPPGEYGWGTVISNGDNFINLNVSNFISITNPLGTDSYIDAGDSLLISANASSDVTKMTVSIDEGSGFVALDSVSSGTSISYYYKPASSINIEIKITATLNGENIEATRSHVIVVKQATVIEDLPAGIRKGINYHDGDDTKVTLVLEAPESDFGYVVGDFSNWEVADSNQMKQTTDGEFLWIELSGLESQKEYVFQYWVDGVAKIGDPYAEKVADPWNDKHIPASVYPDLPIYDKEEFQTATVFQTGQSDYAWAASEDTWERPDLDHLVIYELLVRDFVATHSYSTLMDTLSYLKRLGVDAIELMPFNEFEGNESWGYNPSYYFAPDKYYGPKDSLKKFIETAHQEGFAVIMDMVLNHAYGQNALVKLYWDDAAGKPAANNPWFNRDLPANHFGWGLDFDHESNYTKAFIDSVNKYWLEEYHIDGYRFDYTKGFTNSTSPDSYDASRIAILKRMADEIWSQDPEAYVILEHWGPSNEETELADYGMKLWSNRSYDYVPAIEGHPSNNFNNMDRTSHVQYFNSHDEQRVAYEALQNGSVSSDGTYNVKNVEVMLERKKMLAAFLYLFPGPKMIWQFDELAYDIDINFNDRVGNKPLPWGDGENDLGYYEDPNRQLVYDAYAAILALRNAITADTLGAATTNHTLSGNSRGLSYATKGGEGLVLVCNFSVEVGNIDPKFTKTGWWYNYFSGDSIDVTDVNATMTLSAGEWHIYTTTKYSDGFEGVVEVYQNPVSVNPYPFTKEDEITIRFDASKASNDGTAGLVGASEVYMISGVVTDPSGTELTKIVNDASAQMTNVSGDIWEITLTPESYYSLAVDEDIYKIGVFFRDADSINLGKGFKNSIVYLSVTSVEPLITIEPAHFTANTEITITFNANAGDRGLAEASAVYMHTGVVLSDLASPGGSDWSNVPGDWGDNSWGGMAAVTGKPGFWEITLTPKTFYQNATDDNLEDDTEIYWIAAVFRSSDGNTKGSDSPGEYDWGIIQTGGDIFIKNQPESISVSDPITSDIKKLEVYPNPASDRITIAQENVTLVTIYNITGQVVQEVRFDGTEIPRLDVSDLQSGMYFIKTIDENDNASAGRFLKSN
jgi:glycosidase